MKKKIFTIFLFANLSNGLFAQTSSISTDLVKLGFLSLNAETNVAVTRNVSVGAEIAYSPFYFDALRLQHFYFAANARYWALESFYSLYMESYLFYSRYHIGGIWNKLRYDGSAAGVGLSFGKMIPFNTRLGLDISFGGKIGYFDYQKYRCYTCGNKVGGREKRIHVLPDVGASLIYLF